MSTIINNDFTFTRYLYIKSDVKHSLLLAILEHKKDESLFWTYELYYSGFYSELIDLILLIYNKIYIFTNSKLINFIEKNIKLMEEHPENDLYIGSIIATLVYQKYDLNSFIETYFKVKCVVKPIVSNKLKLHINLKDEDIVAYKTLYGKPNTILQKINKYPTRRNVNRLFDADLYEPTQLLDMYNIHWLYYAYNSQIWKLRIDKYDIIVNHDTRMIEFNDEDQESEFYEKWNYDPDEQPLIICEYHIGTINEPQSNIMEFCNTYNVNIITKKIISRPKPKSITPIM